MKYLEGEEITKLRIAKATIKLNFTQYFVVLPSRTKGFKFDVGCNPDYLPSPLDIPAIKVPDTDEEEERPASGCKISFAALAL